jgi:hypothetical protein
MGKEAAAAVAAASSRLMVKLLLLKLRSWPKQSLWRTWPMRGGPLCPSGGPLLIAWRGPRQEISQHKTRSGKQTWSSEDAHAEAAALTSLAKSKSGAATRRRELSLLQPLRRRGHTPYTTNPQEFQLSLSS